ncbi:MAG: penicillin-binding protein 2, partial [bacterium]
WRRSLAVLAAARPARTARPGFAASSAPSVAASVAEHDLGRPRVRSAGALQLGVAALVLLRLFTIQIIAYPRYSRLARRQHVTEYKLPASRGAILDRNGRVLAVSQEGAAIYLVPRYFFDKKKGGTFDQLRSVCRLTGRSAFEVRAEAARKPFIWLKRPASLADLAAIRDLCARERIQGVGWEPLCLRHYPQGDTAGQVLGFTNDEGRGLEGVEYGYDRYLHRSSSHMNVLRDNRGNLIFTGGHPDEDASAASSLTLTIDTTLQHAAERELDQGLRRQSARWGCAIVMDPTTGEILALANAPRFAPMAGASGPADRRINRAVTTVFEPGSVFKLVTLSAAMQDHEVKEDDVINCERGAFTLADRVIHDVESFSRLSVAEVFAYSSNIGFAKIGLKLGPDRVFRWARDYGFGESTRVGLPGEEKGLLRKAEDRFTCAAQSFGHGLGVTAIQLAVAYASVANGGRRLKPYIVREVRDARGLLRVSNQTEMVRQVVSAGIARRLTEMLVGVVNYGTGRAAAVPGYKIAGKTGTAQVSTP